MTELATWDFEILPIELAALKDAGYALEILAFDDKELAKLLDTGVQQGNTDPDQVPEPPDEPVTPSQNNSSFLPIGSSWSSLSPLLIRHVHHRIDQCF